ncbi:hypothetical protein KUTeg_004402 [Tegillarca granosa]|uniref:P-type domain-containing protein n=1 Tax=Tegillarca granosa TaxID=220873 RepID=A0ABQ9FPV2_TEGGR|nr:hypothetical protein KUTeg_004402 [Tegillarca granosa]
MQRNFPSSIMKQPRLIVLLVGIIVVGFVLWLKSFVLPYVTNLYVEMNIDKIQDGTNKFAYQLQIQKTKSNSINIFAKNVLHKTMHYISSKDKDDSKLYFKSQLFESEISLKLNSKNEVKLTQTTEIKTKLSCDISKDEERFDCYPENDASQQKCEARGCCWRIAKSRQKPLKSTNLNDTQAPLDVPYCYYPKDFPGYKVDSIKNTRLGFTASLSRNTKVYYPNDIMNLMMDVRYETKSRLRIKIYDPAHTRYEVPMTVPSVTNRPSTTDYSVTGIKARQPLNFQVNRVSSDASVPTQLIRTDSAAPFIFADQFIQLSYYLPSKYIYGLGEHRDTLLHNTNWTRFTLWNRDQFPVQYTEVIGRSFMPPYWSLGFHLCRWGYKTANGTLEVADRNKKVGIPQDVQWNDIDYMDRYLDFTISKDFGDQAAMVKALHDRGMHYIMIVDPGISNTQRPGTYNPYDLGMKMDIFVKDALTGKPIIGKVWPGNTVFPDFTHPSSQKYWTSLVTDFHNKVPFDGMWIDMNEMSSFVIGSISGCPKNSTFENPPYVPAVLGGILSSSTLCATAKHYASIQYNVHNLYGYLEGKATNIALTSIRQKRPFIISRSTFAGHGQYAGHWTGDNDATYHDMAISIPAILSMNMFGISVVGADICGFRGNTNEQLCQRWHQLGAFYPFSRNHNSLGLQVLNK